MYVAAKLYNIFVLMVYVSHIFLLLLLVLLGIHQPAIEEPFSYTNVLINLALLASGYCWITYVSTWYLLRQAYSHQQIIDAKRLHRVAKKVAGHEITAWVIIVAVMIITVLDVIGRKYYPNNVWSILTANEFYRPILINLITFAFFQAFYTHRVLVRHQQKRQQRLKVFQ